MKKKEQSVEETKELDDSLRDALVQRNKVGRVVALVQGRQHDEMPRFSS